jgi:hypothetical protein
LFSLLVPVPVEIVEGETNEWVKGSTVLVNKVDEHVAEEGLLLVVEYVAVVLYQLVQRIALKSGDIMKIKANTSSTRTTKSK